MDNQTLSGLQNSIDSAKSKIEQTKQAMLDLVNQAKGFADNLEGELARLKGDDSLALKIEQNKKLADIEQKIAEARKRNNADEVTHLQRALELQRKINAEQSRQAVERKQKEQQQAIVEKKRFNNHQPILVNLILAKLTNRLQNLWKKPKKTENKSC